MNTGQRCQTKTLLCVSIGTDGLKGENVEIKLDKYKYWQDARNFGAQFYDWPLKKFF